MQGYLERMGKLKGFARALIFKKLGFLTCFRFRISGKFILFFVFAQSLKVSGQPQGSPYKSKSTFIWALPVWGRV